MTPATAEKTTTFRSKDQSLRLVKERGQTEIGAGGQIIQSAPDVTIEFRNVGGFGEYVPENDPQFRDDSEAQSGTAEWLRKHDLFNTDFFEVGNEPDRPKVEASEVIAGIIDASNNKDADKVRELARLEYASYSRPVVIDAAKAALRSLGENPEEGIRPSAAAAASSVTQQQVEEIATVLQERLKDSGDLTQPAGQTSDPNPDAQGTQEGAPAQPSGGDPNAPPATTPSGQPTPGAPAPDAPTEAPQTGAADTTTAPGSP